MKKIYKSKFLSSILAMILIVSSLIVPAIPSYANTDMNLVFTAFENYVKAAHLSFSEGRRVRKITIK